MEGFFLFAGSILGGVITFIVVNIYHERTGKKLKNENNKLRELNMRILRYMKDMGLIKWNRDNKGNIVGFDIKEKSESIIADETIKNRTLH